MVWRPNAGALVAPVVLVATAAAMFRVYTAPDRIQQHQKAAKEVCEKSGGRWLSEAGRPICSRA
jgi:hypothetical protein